MVRNSVLVTALCVMCVTVLAGMDKISGETVAYIIGGLVLGGGLFAGGAKVLSKPGPQKNPRTVKPKTKPYHSGLVLLPVLLMFGCCPLAGPADTFLDAVGGEYLTYVEGDDTLNEAQKSIRRQHVEAFAAAVEQAQRTE